jgi:phosphoglycolate phosphatase
MNLLFDLDGTLTNPREGILACIKHALEELKVDSPPDRTLEAMIGPPLRESFSALLGANHDERIDRAITLYRERFLAKGLYENALYPGIREALGQLREAGHALFVATSKPTVYARRIIAHFELGIFFDAVHGSELDGTNSDKVKLIEYVLSVEALKSSRTIMIGDRAHDIAGAKANCLVPIGALWGYGSREELIAAGAETLCQKPDSLLDAVAAVCDSTRVISALSPIG